MFLTCLVPSDLAQKTYTWQELRERFETSNPTLKAAQENVTETRVQEITAYLRPNPDATFGVDQLEPFVANPYRPFSQAPLRIGLSRIDEEAVVGRQHLRQQREKLRLRNQLCGL